MLVRAIGFTVKVAWRVCPPAEAVMMVVEATDTSLLDTGKVTRFAPPGTVTLAGTVAASGFELESNTRLPPGGAVPLSITLCAEVVAAPITETGERDSA